jgi:hypothetical protein
VDLNPVTMVKIDRKMEDDGMVQETRNFCKTGFNKNGVVFCCCNAHDSEKKEKTFMH